MDNYRMDNYRPLRDYTCVCCGDIMPGLRRLPMPLRCAPCQTAYEQTPPTFSVFRSMRDGRWYALRLGRFILLDARGWRRANFATLAEAVAFVQAEQREWERRFPAPSDRLPPTSGGAA